MTNPPGQPGANFDAVLASLRRLRAAARRLLLTRAIATLAAAGLLLFTAAGMLDFALRFPVWMRTGHLVIGAALLVVVCWKYVRPAWRFRPSLTAMAMRVEKHSPELRDLLASGVEFDAALQGDDRKNTTEMESALSRSVVEQAAQAYSAPRSLLNRGPALRAVVTLVISAATIVALTALNTNLAAIGAQRTIAPWSGAEWPKRTGVADATDVAVHPLGMVLPLRAVVTRTNRAIERTDVVARYRTINDGKEGPSQRVLLTWQGRDEATSTGASGAFFERLIEADADMIEYRFETEDDQTPWRRVRLVEPPAIASASAVITPPDYASAIPAGAYAARAELEMGAGADERAIAPPALLGSTIELTLELNKPIPVEAADSAWIAATFSDDFASAAPTITPASGESGTITLSWLLADSTRIPVALVDQFGIESADDAVFRFDAVHDQAPAATVTAPPSDTAVLATAVIDITGEGRDDVGLAWVRLDRQVFRPEGADTGAPSGPGGAMAPSSEPIEIALIESSGETTLEASATIEMQTLGVVVDDEVQITATAADVFGAADLSRAPTVSTPRRLRIVGEEEFVQAIRNELSGVRQSVMRIDARQREARSRAQEIGADQQTIKEQANITDRVAREVESIQQIQSRLAQNRLGDERLDELLENVDRALEQARQSSTEAADALDQLAQAQESQQESEEAADAEREAAQDTDDAQRDVMDQLEEVAAQLDTGEDAWVLQRNLEKMLEAQRSLQERTEQLSAQTAGKSASELSQQERSELEDIVEAQEQLAEQADELADEMREREQQLRETDQTAAAGLSEAAKRAQEERLSETMEQAASEAQQNQTSNASESQQQAAESMEKMLEDLEEGQRAREAALRRILASLIESLEGLVNQQTAELASLSKTIVDGGDLAILDRGMIRLNTNTLGVLDLARNAGRELAPVANLIGDASTSQSRAIVELRRVEIDTDDVRTNEARSLDLLKRALEEAQRLENQMQQQEQDRKKAELLKAYRDALTAQITLRDETEEYAAKDDLSRRDRAALRRIAGEQDAIGSSLDMILESTAELSDAEVFRFAHTRLSSLTEAAAEHLRETETTAAVRRQSAAIAALQGIVESLSEEAPPKDDNFNDGGGGGGEGGEEGGPQQQELLPPVAQLRLLRQMQLDLLSRTRDADEFANEPGVDSPADLGAEQRELGNIGGGIIEKMSQQSGGPGEMPIVPE